MTTFYVASSFSNKDAVRYVSSQLQACGWRHTYDWTKNERAATFAELKEIGTFEKEAVAAADVFIMLLPAGKGSHIEMGMALGMGKHVYLFSETDAVNDFETTSTFYHLSDVQQVIGSLDELIARIQTEN
ncbi:group-specific protein [Bacillus daqingensis]|uniref:Group-specific protein n=1 Tax=Bacillus daqingensis TaxID=872396 RepID=A0ABV9NV49_9BACI